MAIGNTISELASNYEPGFSLEQEFYKNPELYKKELKEIFHKHWILAGHTSQIPNSGDFFLFEFANESIIITRSKDGNVKAHLNVCRHRGSHVCLKEKGNTKAFTCAYHAWSYDLDGNLIGARMMNNDFDASEYGLHQAHVNLFGGLIFISLADEPPSMDALHNDLSDVIDQLGFNHMKLAKQKTYTIRSNWKLAVENYQECYHCAPSHKEFAKIHAMAQNPDKYEKQKEAFLNEKRSAIRTKPSSFYFDKAKPGQEGYQYDRNPLLSGKKSGSLGGKPVAPLLGILEKHEEAASELMIGPVTYFLIYDDHMLGYRFLPTAIDECICDLFWFVREGAEKGKDYDLETLTWLWHVTILDDEEIIVNNQKGVNSDFYSPGKLADMEFFLQHFLNWYIEKIK